LENEKKKAKKMRFRQMRLSARLSPVVACRCLRSRTRRRTYRRRRRRS